VIQDIPKLYTALAEWLACVLFVRLLPQRYNAAKTAGILAAALPLFGLVQWLIGIVPLSLWIPGMIVALVLMYATIWLCCRLNFCDTGFWWALAFTLAEFVASHQRCRAVGGYRDCSCWLFMAAALAFFCDLSRKG
jgi:hypothetical protein